MHRVVGHAFLPPRWKEFSKTSPAPPDNISVGTRIEPSRVWDGNELEIAVAEERPLHAAGARINTDAKQSDFQSGTK
jgi:hypothetical protein